MLQDNDKKTEVIKALRVSEILEDTVGHGSYKAITNRFPNINPKVFEELSERKLDLLVGNPHLGLQPKCGTGSGCKDCLQNLCCYTSRFLYGHVLICSLKNQEGVWANKVSSIRRIALCNVLEGAFFQGEALGVSPIERCTSCKNRDQNFYFCSEDQTPMTAPQEEEYRSLKLHCQFDCNKGCLLAKYPFSLYPRILVDNSNSALACLE